MPSSDTATGTVKLHWHSQFVSLCWQSLICRQPLSSRLLLLKLHMLFTPKGLSFVSVTSHAHTHTQDGLTHISSSYVSPPPQPVLQVMSVWHSAQGGQIFLIPRNHLPNFAFLKTTSLFLGIKNYQKHQILTKKRQKNNFTIKRIIRKKQNH